MVCEESRPDSAPEAEPADSSVSEVDRQEFERLLQAARDQSAGAVDQLMPVIYDRLQLLARRQLRRLRPGQTLQTTALVHEAYMRLAGTDPRDWRDRNHFLCTAAVAMRQILVDQARRRAAHKRGGDQDPVTLNGLDREPTPGGSGSTARAVEVLDLDRALEQLREASPRLAQLVELRYFGGLTVEEVAEVLELSTRTAERDWRKARAFLHRVLSP